MSAITPFRAGLAAIVSGILLIAAALMRGDPADDDIDGWLDGDDDAGWTRDDHPIWGW
jgi:hypothetical protein